MIEAQVDRRAVSTWAFCCAQILSDGARMIDCRSVVRDGEQIKALWVQQPDKVAEF